MGHVKRFDIKAHLAKIKEDAAEAEIRDKMEFEIYQEKNIARGVENPLDNALDKFGEIDELEQL